MCIIPALAWAGTACLLIATRVAPLEGAHTYALRGIRGLKAEEPGYHSKVITADRAVNDYMPLHVFELLVDALNECERAVKGSKVVVLGFSYKENVGDHRESPVVILLEELRKKGARVHIIDPYIEDVYLEKFGEAQKDVYKALEGADAMVMMTAHREFREIDMRRVKEGMRTPIVIDGRRVRAEGMGGLGFVYRGVGAGNKI
jgi:nucleotide sugar dehydrogenase